MKRICLLALLGMAAAIQTFAQPTLDDCKAKARENYPLIRNYDLITLTKEYTLDLAAKAWLPQVSLSGQATYQSDVMKWPEQFETMFATL